MNDVAVSQSEELAEGYLAPRCSVAGPARSACFAPEGFSLWQVTAELEAGTELRWDGDHGDEGLLITDGEVAVDGTTCGRSGVIAVESGCSTVVRALTPTRLVHCGAHDPRPPTDGPFGPPAAEGHGVHCFADGQAAVRVQAAGLPLANEIFVEGTCPTCRIALFVVDGSEAHDGYVGRSHFHSSDEIIHVLDGEIRVGRAVIARGQSVAIPADRRYSFRSPGAFRFLNYRRDAATATFAPGSAAVLETVAGLASSGVASAD